MNCEFIHIVHIIYIIVDAYLATHEKAHKDKNVIRRNEKEEVCSLCFYTLDMIQDYCFHDKRMSNSLISNQIKNLSVVWLMRNDTIQFPWHFICHFIPICLHWRRSNESKSVKDSKKIDRNLCFQHTQKKKT